MNKRINRINLNEKRLDKITNNVKTLQEHLEIFKNNKKDFDLLNKYYGSKNWLEDKELYEKNKISKIKAGVLSEDAVWNLDEDMNSLIKEMKEIIVKYNK